MDKQKTQQTNTKANNEFKQNMLKVQDELNEGTQERSTLCGVNASVNYHYRSRRATECNAAIS